MKFIETLGTNEATISLEIIPPTKGRKIDELFSAIDKLMQFNPKFINVTNHQPKVVYKEIDGKIQKLFENKKPGTVSVSAAIKNRFNVESVPHLICGGVNKFQIEDMLIDLQYLEIENVFIVRGDPQGSREFNKEPDGFKYADELVKQVNNMNNGIYTQQLDKAISSDFCIGVAGYPEKHFEALNIEKDMLTLKNKVEAGADYIITQMFFNHEHYFKFVEKARDLGITIPIIPGIKPIVKEKFLKTIPRAFYIDIPQKLVKAFESARTPKEEFEAGTQYVANMVQELIEYGVPGIHLFTMGKGKSTAALLKRIKHNS